MDPFKGSLLGIRFADPFEGSLVGDPFWGYSQGSYEGSIKALSYIAGFIM